MRRRQGGSDQQKPAGSYLRRSSDGAFVKRLRPGSGAPDDAVRSMPWEDQRTQFLTRFLFWAMYLAYFNLGDVELRPWPGIVAVNAVGVIYLLLSIVYMVHAWNNNHSPTRWRIAMWTDLIMVSAAVISDARIMSPTYLAYIMVILGNGMRYGLRFFGEAVVGTFALVLAMIVFRNADFLRSVSVSTLIYMAAFGIIIVYSYSLMSSIEKVRQRLQRESSLDHLTGLLNRRGLYEKSGRLFHAMHAQQLPLTILFADLDGFKSINDSLGHPAGDNVLREVGGMVAGCMRHSDVAARFGGDEFVILLPDCVVDNALHVARRLRESVSEWSQRTGITLSVSIGLGEAPRHGCDLDSVLERVDTAMYRGKLESGKGGIQIAEAG